MWAVVKDMDVCQVYPLYTKKDWTRKYWFSFYCALSSIVKCIYQVIIRRKKILDKTSRNS